MRSLMFVPGDDERKIAKGLGSEADALILDLEDAVAPTRKDAARAITAGALQTAGGGKRIIVRVNAFDTGHTLSDLAAVVRARPWGIMLPKCRGGDDVRLLGHYLDALETREDIAQGATRILAVATESSQSMFGLGTYAGLARLRGLLWGGEDLAADIGAVANRDAGGRYTAPFELARSLTVHGAAAAGVDAIDAVYTNFRDTAGLAAEAAAALRDGFTAKAAIHPDQIGPINAAFTPSTADVAWARRIVAAFDDTPGLGVISLDGKMIDRPHYRSATRVLARAQPTA